LLVSTPLRAADRVEQRENPLEFTWSAPTHCPQRADVMKHIESLLRDSEGMPSRSSVVARGVIEPAGERYQLTLTLREEDTTGKRVVTADNCDSLGKAAAVIVGLLIRRERQLGRQLSGQEISGVLADPANSPKLSANPDERDVSAGSQPKEADQNRQLNPTAPAGVDSDWHLALFAPLVSLDYRTLPKEAIGIGLAIGVLRESWRLMLATQFFLPQSKASPNTSVYEAKFQRESIELWGCHGWRWHALELAPCAQLQLDLIQARASGDRLSSLARWVPVPSAGGGLLALWHLHPRASLVVAGSGRAFLFRPEFMVEGIELTEQAHREPFGTLVASVASEWIF
ncbi:MAG TPA: hypothetical protein VIV60_23545, partial [Polyangiaceae bacterium]